ncbi:uncharacterized protein LOC133358576 [Lethenteron reissneri]|uniref:uncharacterized protein LOC133358576 n=1 Tax=Lethenteron reissneri TaxID=7753 RepID=UPI002AB67536|nr:uncharacterized protein LOC133358576 [Lethenteron reissneri]
MSKCVSVFPRWPPASAVSTPVLAGVVAGVSFFSLSLLFSSVAAALAAHRRRRRERRRRGVVVRAVSHGRHQWRATSEPEPAPVPGPPSPPPDQRGDVWIVQQRERQQHYNCRAYESDYSRGGTGSGKPIPLVLSSPPSPCCGEDKARAPLVARDDSAAGASAADRPRFFGTGRRGAGSGLGRYRIPALDDSASSARHLLRAGATGVTSTAPRRRRRRKRLNLSGGSQLSLGCLSERGASDSEGCYCVADADAAAAAARRQDQAAGARPIGKISRGADGKFAIAGGGGSDEFDDARLGRPPPPPEPGASSSPRGSALLTAWPSGSSVVEVYPWAGAGPIRLDARRRLAAPVRRRGQGRAAAAPAAASSLCPTSAPSSPAAAAANGPPARNLGRPWPAEERPPPPPPPPWTRVGGRVSPGRCRDAAETELDELLAESFSRSPERRAAPALPPLPPPPPPPYASIDVVEACNIADRLLELTRRQKGAAVTAVAAARRSPGGRAQSAEQRPRRVTVAGAGVPCSGEGGGFSHPSVPCGGGFGGGGGFGYPTMPCVAGGGGGGGLTHPSMPCGSPQTESSGVHSQDGSQRMMGNESLYSDLANRRELSVDEGYEWDVELCAESAVMQSLRLYVSRQLQRPHSSDFARERPPTHAGGGGGGGGSGGGGSAPSRPGIPVTSRPSVSMEDLSCGGGDVASAAVAVTTTPSPPSSSSSTAVAPPSWRADGGADAPLRADLAARCAALKAEFLAYQRHYRPQKGAATRPSSGRAGRPRRSPTRSTSRPRCCDVAAERRQGVRAGHAAVNLRRRADAHTEPSRRMVLARHGLVFPLAHLSRAGEWCWRGAGCVFSTGDLPKPRRNQGA